MPDGFVDPYIDLRTGVLRNLVGAGTWDELRNAEGELVAMRTSEFLRELPLEPTGTLDDLRCIHRWLFRDVYDWAGEVRTVEIRKAGEGVQFFLPSASMPRGIAWARSELEKDDLLAGVAPRRFPGRMAYHYDTYNFVHPFREGGMPVTRFERTILDFALLGENPSLVRGALADARRAGLDEDRLRYHLFMRAHLEHPLLRT